MPKLLRSIQARRTRVKLSIVDQRPEGKKRRKYKEIGAPAKLVPAALFTAPALFILAAPCSPAFHAFVVFVAIFFVSSHFVLVIAFSFNFFL